MVTGSRISKGVHLLARWTRALGTKLAVGHRDMLIHQQVAKRDPVGKFEQIDPKQSKII